MSLSNLGTLAALLLAALALVSPILTLIGNWRGAKSKAGKDDASSAQIMVDTATKLANDLGRRLDDTNTLVAKLQTALAARDQRITDLETQLGQRDKHIATLEAKVDLLIKLYGRDPFEGKPGTGPLVSK